MNPRAIVANRRRATENRPIKRYTAIRTTKLSRRPAAAYLTSVTVGGTYALGSTSDLTIASPGA